jgi:hypothetical protein
MGKPELAGGLPEASALRDASGGVGYNGSPMLIGVTVEAASTTRDGESALLRGAESRHIVHVYLVTRQVP